MQPHLTPFAVDVEETIDTKLSPGSMKETKRAAGQKPELDAAGLLPKNRRAKREITTTRPWFRQRGESVQSYSAFQTYLAMPQETRSLIRVAEVVGKSGQLMRNWSSEWSWVMRVAAYEEHFLLIRLDSLAADRDTMWTEQQALGNKVVGLVGSAFEGLIGEYMGQDGKLDIKAMKPEVMVRLLAEATKLQRQATLGRVESAEKIAETNEKISERYAEELVSMFQTFLNRMNLSDEQLTVAQGVIVDILESGDDSGI